jgi:DNA-binding NarL/FixJ family response regulator
MTTPVSGIAASGGTSASVQIQPKAVAAAPAPRPTSSGEDTVKISAAAQEVKQPTSSQVRLMRAQGESIPQIATKLAITPSAVQSYLGTPQKAASATK